MNESCLAAGGCLVDLIIARLPGLYPLDRIRLFESGKGEADLIHCSKKGIEDIIGRELKVFWDIEKIRALAGRDAEISALRGIQWVSWNQAAYPPLLREIYDPPGVLFFRGRLPDPERPLVGIVGTRRPSPQAAAQAFDIARDLGREGLSVVSGLALGIDAMSHRGSLEGGGPTYAVLGSGVDEVYPSSNRMLAKRIVENGGALLSEYPPGTRPFKGHFPARNRIISGLSRGVLVVEAPPASGARITARRALEQDRDLWVASSGADLNGQGYTAALYDRGGTAKLADEGAGIVASAADILREWNWKKETAEAAGSSRTGAALNAAEYTYGRALAASLAETLDIDL